jgi:hypothetical protein
MHPAPYHSATRLSGLTVPTVAPVQGWTLMKSEERDGDGFFTDLYFARSDECDQILNHCRFGFNPTQARFDFLIVSGFPPAGPGSWTNAKIDAAIASQIELAQ